MVEDNEYSGGYVLRDCPDCGQFCKVPEFYYPKFGPSMYGEKMDHVFKGCFAKSYCKRCKKDVELGVEFL